MIHIDGAYGEGGGQVLRTALSLSMVTGKSFRIDNIRAARPRPGLRRQHLTAVRAAQALSKAEVEGADIGSATLTFEPKTICAGDYELDIETAGSTILVAETLIPALLKASAESRVVLHGGTHNPQSPPFDFLQKVFLPVLRKMGAKLEAKLIRPGYFPAGGGLMEMKISPATKLRRLELMERGRLLTCTAEAVVAGLPESIAQRELQVIRDELGWDDLRVRLETRCPGPGNVVMLVVECEGITDLFTSYGMRRVPAEKVARRAAEQVAAYLAGEAAVDRFLADQLLLPMALAGGGCFTTLRPSAHTLTNIAVIEQFLPVRIVPEQVAQSKWTVKVHGVG